MLPRCQLINDLKIVVVVDSRNVIEVVEVKIRAVFEVLDNVKSAIKFHIETFGSEVLDSDSDVLEAFVVEAAISEQ